MKLLRTSDFALASAQVVYFTPDQEFSAASVARDVVPRLIGDLDAAPMVLPAPPAPPNLVADVPRVLLGTRDQMWRLEIAPGRAQCFWNRISEDSPNPPLEEVFLRASEFLYRYLQAQRVGRVAVVLNRVATHDAPGIFLAQHFCREALLKAPFNRPEEFALHAHKRFTLAGKFLVNSWVKNSVASLSISKRPPRPVVVVEQDLNTPAEDASTRSFSSSDSSEFLRACATEFESILGLYYP